MTSVHRWRTALGRCMEGLEVKLVLFLNWAQTGGGWWARRLVTAVNRKQCALAYEWVSPRFVQPREKEYFSAVDNRAVCTSSVRFWSLKDGQSAGGPNSARELARAGYLFRFVQPISCRYHRTSDWLLALRLRSSPARIWQMTYILIFCWPCISIILS